MLKKLRLKKADQYELAIATSYIADMLVGFIEGHEHYHELGCEQGGIQKWDDLVLKDSEEIYTHVQVKRQTTDFDERDVSNLYQGAPYKGKASPLDETMASLAKWVEDNDEEAVKKRKKFIIELPSGDISIKSNKDLNLDFEVRHFHDLCSQFNDATTVEGLKSQQSACDDTNNLFLWLTKWCDFMDWSHILNAMLILEIKDSGRENVIHERVERDLCRCFKDGKSVRKKIQEYINENSNYPDTITPRLFMHELVAHLRDDLSTWTQYQNDNGWSVAGIHDERRDGIEKPSRVVNKLWGGDNKKRALKVSASSPSNLYEMLPRHIVHLALHIQAPSSAYFQDLPAWRNVTENSIVTLGTDDNDLIKNLSWVENTAPLSASEPHDLTSTRECDEQAESLLLHIYDTTWKNVYTELEKEISSMKKSDLKYAVDERWVSWKKKLNQDPVERNNLLKKMLKPTCESENIQAELRVGLKTVGILVKGLLMHLVVSVALDSKESGWRECKGSKLQVIALSHWSGPAGSPRKARDLADDAASILGKEPASILILSRVKDTPEVLYEETLASSSITQNHLATAHRPELLVTNYRALRKLIENGDISSIREHLEKSLNAYQTSQEESLNKVAMV